MSDHHSHRPAPRRGPLLGRNQRLLLLAALALAAFALGTATMSTLAIAGSLILGGAAIALSLDTDRRPPADPADAPTAVERAAQAMSSGWGPTSWEHCDPGQRALILCWARAAIRAYQTQQTAGPGAGQ
jgi:hypothetical protein